MTTTEYSSKRNKLMVTVSKEDWDKMHAYVQCCDEELSIFGLTKAVRLKDGNLTNNRIHIYRLLPLPLQFNTGSTTEVEADDLQKMLEEQIPDVKERKNMTLWVH
jgi:hypothetical protein